MMKESVRCYVRCCNDPTSSLIQAHALKQAFDAYWSTPPDVSSAQMGQAFPNRHELERNLEVLRMLDDALNKKGGLLKTKNLGANLGANLPQLGFGQGGAFFQMGGAGN